MLPFFVPVAQPRHRVGAVACRHPAFGSEL
jgi:hypothetical protein